MLTAIIVVVLCLTVGAASAQESIYVQVFNTHSRVLQGCALLAEAFGVLASVHRSGRHAEVIWHHVLCPGRGPTTITEPMAPIVFLRWETFQRIQ